MNNKVLVELHFLSNTSENPILELTPIQNVHI